MSTLSRTPSDTATPEVEALTQAAAVAAPDWSATPDAERARSLRAVADALDSAVEDLVAAADAETSLGVTRLTGEVARTSGQLRMFADFVVRGAHLQPTITEADAAGGRPDVRSLRVALGPVAVFAASNFPFAFSVVGGDTASALAAGCPVVVKAHEGHPRTSALTAELVGSALRVTNAPEGTFSIVYGQTAGAELVQAPAIRAVGFTGSLAGARALTELIHRRPDPIPFYGELGSVNPVVVLPGAAAARAAEIAEGYAASLTLGAGQFCTNPGLTFVPEDSPVPAAVTDALAATHAAPMLTARIREQYEQRIADDEWAQLRLLGRGEEGEGDESPVPEVRTVDLPSFLDDIEALTEERFGPAGLLVTYPDADRLLGALSRLPGSLTGSIHASEEESDLAGRAAMALRPRVGRLIYNGWPTGVAVCWAMMHGGPWPASTAPGTTSVGTRAIDRWLVPVAYQDFPDALLPEPLRAVDPAERDRTVQPEAH